MVSNDRLPGREWRVPRVEAIDNVCEIVGAPASFEAEERRRLKGRTKNKTTRKYHTKYRIMGLDTEVLPPREVWMRPQPSASPLCDLQLTLPVILPRLPALTTSVTMHEEKKHFQKHTPSPSRAWV